MYLEEADVVTDCSFQNLALIALVASVQSESIGHGDTLVQLLLLTCIYSTDSRQVGQESKVEPRNGKAVLLTVPAAGFVIYE